MDRGAIPKVILILCEGETEKIYFNLVIKHRRPMVAIEVFGRQGQYESLVKACIEKRKQKIEEYGFDEDDIEAWAVCDRDGLKKKQVRKLWRYADSNNINLAFSDPQFETYLVQHFHCTRINKKKDELEVFLSSLIGEEYNKVDLSWLDKKIDERLVILDQAIENSSKLDNRTKTPFLTVHKLTKRIVYLERG